MRVWLYVCVMLRGCSLALSLVHTLQAGRQIDPKNVPKKHRRGSLSDNLKRLFGKRAVAQLDGEDTRKKAGFE